jgi:XTP/dITP diphosphohydrolase
MIPRLVIATHNRHKAGEMQTILGARFPSLEILTLADFPGAPEPEETGSTYGENAAIKALSACAFTGEASIADDAGLEVDALEGAPGLYSRRFEGDETPFPLKMAKILQLLDRLPPEKRTARFRCNVAYAVPKKMVRHFEAVCEGQIARQPSGTGGFGYDPIFYLPSIGCSMAELSSEEKHEVSHRGAVLRQFAVFLSRQ